MDGNSAKKAPVLERLVNTPPSAGVPQKPAMAQKPAATVPQNKLAQAQKPNLPPTNGNGQVKQNRTTAIESLDTPKNRRTDKSQFELELAQIVHKIMSQYIGQASEEIVSQVLREVRARLPGQRRQ